MIRVLYGIIFATIVFLSVENFAENVNSKPQNKTFSGVKSPSTDVTVKSLMREDYPYEKIKFKEIDNDNKLEGLVRGYYRNGNLKSEKNYKHTLHLSEKIKLRLFLLFVTPIIMLQSLNLTLYIQIIPTLYFHLIHSRFIIPVLPVLIF